MINNESNNAVLSVYSQFGDLIAELNLSPVQLKAIVKILGIQPAGDGRVSMFSDESLELFLQKTVDRWQGLDFKLLDND